MSLPPAWQNRDGLGGNFRFQGQRVSKEFGRPFWACCLCVCESQGAALGYLGADRWS
jgi:hypothetical protein